MDCDNGSDGQCDDDDADDQRGDDDDEDEHVRNEKNISITRKKKELWTRKSMLSRCVRM